MSNWNTDHIKSKKTNLRFVYLRIVMIFKNVPMNETVISPEVVLDGELLITVKSN